MKCDECIYFFTVRYKTYEDEPPRYSKQVCRIFGPMTNEIVCECTGFEKSPLSIETVVTSTESGEFEVPSVEMCEPAKIDKAEILEAGKKLRKNHGNRGRPRKLQSI